jgi:broad specificity phosphatase PhoE
VNNKYFLLRHGQTIYQTEKKDILYPFPEKTPICLTEKGIEQIKRIAKELKARGVDLIFSSDTFRARQTVEIIAKELGLGINLEKRLRDVNFGIFGGKSKKEYRAFFTDRKEKFFKRPPQGESWNDVRKRISDFLKEIEKKYKNKNILIVSHGDPLWLLAGIIKGLKNEEEFLKEKYKILYPEVGQLLIP